MLYHLPTSRYRPPRVSVLHRIPGRVRFRLRELGEPAAQRVRDQLARIGGITSATLNLRTRSLLVEHSCGFDDLVGYITDIARSYAHEGPPIERSVGAMAARAPEWSEISTEEALGRLGTSPAEGLGADAVDERLRRYGDNVIAEQPPPPFAHYVFDQVATTPIALLGAAAVLSVMTGGIADAVGIAVAIAVNSAIGATTEWQSDKTIRLLSQPASDECRVIRNGQLGNTRIGSLVPGDVLPLEPGDLVPADARLLLSDRLMVDESALTGESMPRRKNATIICDENTPLAEQDNLVFRGTAITGGSGLAAVIATGARTEMGRIQSAAEAAVAPQTPMERQLGEVGAQLTWLSVLACAGVFGLGLLRGERLLQMFKSAVSLGVAAVPEGLPAVATTTLAIGLRNMRDEGLLVRNINAVETIGAVDVVCLDKTGTLTKNRIAPIAAYVANRSYEVTEDRILDNGQRVNILQQPELRSLMELVAINNDSTFSSIDGHYSYEGTPTENALLEIGHIAGLDLAAIRERYPRLATRYRSEAEPYMTTLHRSGTRGRLTIAKGNPRDVLKLCTRIRRRGRRDLLNDRTRARILDINDQWTSRSQRVLGVAYDQFGEDQEPVHDELTWLGLVGMQDPLRHGMTNMIEDLHGAGISTVMITGDQMGTAAAIGKELKLSGSESLRVLDSRDLSRLDPDVREAIVQQTDVFARVSPAAKLEIVQSLQGGDKVVAMTGDGINDGPALKAADVGIAMGNAQNDVARSVSDIVVADDRLESVIAALAQGRAIYSNVRKSIHYLVATNLSEIEVMLAGSALGLGLPLTPMQLLWINLATDALPAIALGLEAPEPDVLGHKPRPRSQKIISRHKLGIMLRESAVITGGTVAAMLLGRGLYGPGPRARTMGFNTLIIAQLLHAFACRSDRPVWDRNAAPRSNRLLTSAVVASLGIQAVGLVFPPVRRFLGSSRLGLFDIVSSTAIGGTTVLANELFKTRKEQEDER